MIHVFITMCRIIFVRHFFMHQRRVRNDAHVCTTNTCPALFTGKYCVKEQSGFAKVQMLFCCSCWRQRPPEQYSRTIYNSAMRCVICHTHTTQRYKKLNSVFKTHTHREKQNKTKNNSCSQIPWSRAKEGICNSASRVFMRLSAARLQVTERVVQHFVHCIETHGRHVQYLKFLQTIVKSEGTYIRKCQDTVMAEVSTTSAMCYKTSLRCSRKGTQCRKVRLFRKVSVRDRRCKVIDTDLLQNFRFHLPRPSSVLSYVIRFVHIWWGKNEKPARIFGMWSCGLNAVQCPPVCLSRNNIR